MAGTRVLPYLQHSLISASCSALWDMFEKIFFELNHTYHSRLFGHGMAASDSCSSHRNKSDVINADKSCPQPLPGMIQDLLGAFPHSLTLLCWWCHFTFLFFIFLWKTRPHLAALWLLSVTWLHFPCSHSPTEHSPASTPNKSQWVGALWPLGPEENENKIIT